MADTKKNTMPPKGPKGPGGRGPMGPKPKIKNPGKLFMRLMKYVLYYNRMKIAQELLFQR